MEAAGHRNPRKISNGELVTSVELAERGDRAGRICCRLP
jgi:hypothetical protein